jgi:hypothetical protein
MKMSERTLRRVLAFAKTNPIKSSKPVSLRLMNISKPTRMQIVIDLEEGMTRF